MLKAQLKMIDDVTRYIEEVTRNINQVEDKEALEQLTADLFILENTDIYSDMTELLKRIKETVTGILEEIDKDEE